MLRGTTAWDWGSADYLNSCGLYPRAAYIDIIRGKHFHFHRFSMKMMFAPDSGLRCSRNSSDRLHLSYVAGGEASIFVRKALQVRLRDQQCVCIAKLGRQDLRFSMKIMPNCRLLRLRCSPSELPYHVNSALYRRGFAWYTFRIAGESR